MGFIHKGTDKKRTPLWGCVIVLSFMVMPLFLSSSLAQQCGFTGGESTSSIVTSTACASSELREVENNELFIPYQGDDRDLKEVRVIFHVIQKSVSDPHNFTTQNVDYIESLLDIVNNNIFNPINCPIWNSNGGCVCDEQYCRITSGPDNCCIEDTKIRFVLEDILFHVDEYAFDASQPPGGNYPSIGGCGGTSSYFFDEYGVNKDCALNVFFLGQIPGVTYQGCGPGYNNESTNLAFLVGAYDAYEIIKDAPDFSNKRQFWAGVLAHEIGHCLGLHHTFRTSQQSDFPDIYPDVLSPGTCDVNGANCYNNVMNYSNVQNYLSPLQIGQMHRLLMGSWRSKQLILDYNPDYSVTITDTEVWSRARIVRGDIILEPDSELTVECKLLMASGSRILVKQGAKLVVESGGHITGKYASCTPNRSWAGIEVLGNPTASQFNQNLQGVVVLKEGSIIELAQIGVSLHRRHPVILGGGILQADGAHFINNQTGISFWDYENFLPVPSQTPWRNLSSVRNCTFTVDGAFPESEFLSPWFNSHISMYDVRGINITDCTFKDERGSAIDLPGNVIAGSGIYTVNAQFSVRNSTFSKMLFGVNANNINNSFTFSVRETEFQDNFVGISARGVNNFTAVDNTFKVGGFNRAVAGVENSGAEIGIFIDRASGFVVSDNNFFGQGGAQTKIGVLAQSTSIELDSGENLGEYTEIDGNEFNALDFGNLANGPNADRGGETGLTYLCNKNGGQEDNATDFAVAQGTVASFQRAPDGAGAGNSFTLVADPEQACAAMSPFEHIDNADGGSFMRYFFFDDSADDEEEPFCYPDGLVEKIVAPENSCSSKGEKEDEITKEDREKAKEDVLKKKERFNQANQAYRGLIDGGNTAAAKQSVSSITRLNRLSRLAALHGLSPYLSGEALQLIVVNDKLSSEQKVEVLKLNPEELRRAQTWAYIAESQVFSSAEMDTLLAARQTVTPRDSLELDLAGKQAALQRGADMLLRHYLTDTTDWKLDSIAFWAETKQSGLAAYQAVDAHLSAKDTAAALLALQDMEQAYGLDPAQEQEHGLMKSLKLLEIELIGQERGWHELDTVQLGQLAHIAGFDGTAAALRAQNVLNAFYGEGSYHRPALPGSAQALSAPLPPSTAAAERRHSIRAFPNPARQAVAFEFQLPEEVERAELHIRDMNGRIVERLALLAGQGSASWDSSPWPSGLYFYSLLLPNGQVETHKLVIMR